MPENSCGKSFHSKFSWTEQKNYLSKNNNNGNGRIVISHKVSLCLLKKIKHFEEKNNKSK